jgi:spore coat polysaccharide biosynthesis protein SpsF
MTKTAAIIQARLGSSRLPAKVLLPLPTTPGRTVLEEVTYRCKLIQGVDVVVVAIPDTAENDILVPYIQNAMQPTGALEAVNPQKVFISRGPEHDVLARYAKAAHEVGADVVMRITSDCPLIDPRVCEQVLAQHRKYGGYASNTLPRTWPQGYDCEVFDAALLHRAAEKATSDYYREHVTPFLYYGEPICLAPNVTASEDRSHLRLTLDTLSDYVTICKAFNDIDQHQRAA